MESVAKVSLTRRAFLATLGLLTTTLVSASSPARADGRRRLVLEIVLRRVDYLRIAEADLSRFAADYVASQGWRISEIGKEVRFLRLYGTPLFTLLNGDRQTAAMESLEREVVTAILLSTDFFRSEMRRGQAVTYRGFPPAACENPFARFD